jgi:WhiB family redox-sensing transcriptional regulator
MDRGACNQANPDIFFPRHRGGQVDAREAKRVCRGCEVMERCLSYALSDNRIAGIWGGTTGREREILRRTV